MVRKSAVIILLLLFIFSCFSFNVTSRIDSRDTYYVGGSGDGNFSSISDCINTSKDGDIIFVYEGEYLEDILINKSISLISKVKGSAVLNGENQFNLINIVSSNVTIEGFLLKNTSIAVLVKRDLKNISIKNNKFCNNSNGILINENTSNLTIVSNLFYNNSESIRLYNCSQTYFFNNTIFNSNRYGIVLRNRSNFINISQNKIYFSGDAISNEDFSNNNVILDNNLSNNKRGIYAIFCENLFVSKNYFSNNSLNAIYIENSGFFNISNNSIINSNFGIYVNSCYNYSTFGNIFIGNNQDKKVSRKPPKIPGFEVTLLILFLLISFVVFYVYLEKFRKK